MSNDSSSSNEYYPLFFRTGIWECIVFIIGAPTNLLVVCLAISLICRSQKRSRGPKTYNQYYVLSMTFADLTFCAIHAPLYGIQYVWQLDYSIHLCRFLYIMTHTSTVSSSLSLLCLNIDKFVAVHKPLHHILIMNKKTTLRLLACTWTISLSWAILLTLGPIIKMPESCEVSLNYRTAYYIFAVVFFVLPIFCSFIIAIYVVIVTSRSSIARNESAQSTQFAPHNNNHRHSKVEFTNSHTSQIAITSNAKQTLSQRHCTRPQKSKKAIDRYKSRARTLTFVFFTTIWSFVTSIPYRLSFILNIFKYSSMDLSMFLFGLMAANALGNCFITLLLQRQYRRLVGKLINKARFKKH